jgi:hypothetical protein
VAAAGGEVLTVPTDVSSRQEVRQLEATVLDRFIRPGFERLMTTFPHGSRSEAAPASTA